MAKTRWYHNMFASKDKKKLNTTVLLSVLFIIQAVLSPVFISGGVLCIAEDHIAIEFDQVTHSQFPELPIPSSQGKASQGYHQDTCSDIPLFQYEKTYFLKKSNDSIHQPGKPIFPGVKPLLSHLYSEQTTNNSPSCVILKLLQHTVLLI